MNLLTERQTARATARLGKRIRFKSEVDVSTGGLLAITGLVCGILLTTTCLVASTIRESRRLPRR